MMLNNKVSREEVQYYNLKFDSTRKRKSDGRKEGRRG